MSTEMNYEDLSKYSVSRQGQYDLQAAGSKYSKWRSFLLEEAEIRRLELVENNFPGPRNFDKHVQLVARITGIPVYSIESTHLLGQVLTVVPKIIK